MLIKLSILIPTVPSRIDLYYPHLIKNLLKQTKCRNDVEILALFDNKKRTLGEKRNDLLKLANGEYLVFIDDDDRISDDYVNSIMTPLYNNLESDCVVFDSITHINNEAKKTLCKYGIEFANGGYINNNKTEWRGKPAHTMVYKSSIAKKHKFKHISHGEDVDWVNRAYKDIVKQTRIDKVLYYYDANYNTTSETANLSDDVIKKNVDLLLQSKNKQ